MVDQYFGDSKILQLCQVIYLLVGWFVIIVLRTGLGASMHTIVGLGWVLVKFGYMSVFMEISLYYQLLFCKNTHHTAKDTNYQCNFRCHLDLEDNVISFSIANCSFLRYQFFNTKNFVKYHQHGSGGEAPHQVRSSQDRLILLNIQVVRVEKKVLEWCKAVPPCQTAVIWQQDGHCETWSWVFF